MEGLFAGCVFPALPKQTSLGGNVQKKYMFAVWAASISQRYTSSISPVRLDMARAVFAISGFFSSFFYINFVRTVLAGARTEICYDPAESPGYNGYITTERILSDTDLPFSWRSFFSVTVNLTENGSQKVDMTHFDLLKVLGTGGERQRNAFSET